MRNYLTACGLSSAMVSSEGYGESQPIASNDSAEGRQANRRVEIVVQPAESVASSGDSKSH